MFSHKQIYVWLFCSLALCRTSKGAKSGTSSFLLIWSINLACPFYVSLGRCGSSISTMKEIQLTLTKSWRDLLYKDAGMNVCLAPTIMPGRNWLKISTSRCSGAVLPTNTWSSLSYLSDVKPHLIFADWLLNIFLLETPSCSLSEEKSISELVA